MNFEDSMQCLLQKDPVVEFKLSFQLQGNKGRTLYILAKTKSGLCMHVTLLMTFVLERKAIHVLIMLIEIQQEEDTELKLAEAKNACMCMVVSPKTTCIK
jgi:hypothetical protein